MVKVSREQSAQLRRRVLDAAVAELAVSGPSSLAVTAVADRAGVATSAVSHRFATKERLIGAVVDERLEPQVGRRVDEVSDWLWGPPEPAPVLRRSAADAEGLDAWRQVLVAAAFPSGPRDDALALLERRVGHGRARRAAAPSSTVRPGPDPTAQTLLPLAVDLGTWLLTRGLGRPSRREPGVTALVRSTVRVEPPPPAATAPARRIPRNPAPLTRHAHDRLGETLLDATGAAVAGDGFAGTTVADIARRAGSSTGAVYNRFTGKGGLLAECLLAASPTGADDRTAAIRVESLRVAPTDAEVAAAVTSAVGRTLAVEARAIAGTQRDKGSWTVLAPSAVARLKVAFSIGHWVLGRILAAPNDAWSAAGALIVEDLAAAACPGHDDGDDGVSERR